MRPNGHITRCTAVVALFSLSSMACHKTQSLRAPIEAADLEAIGDSDQVQITRKDGQVIEFHSSTIWRLEGDSILGYRQTPEPDLPADVVIPLSDIESIRVRSEDGISQAEGLILGIAGAAVALLLLVIATLGSSTS